MNRDLLALPLAFTPLTNGRMTKQEQGNSGPWYGLLTRVSLTVALRTGWLSWREREVWTMSLS